MAINNVSPIAVMHEINISILLIIEHSNGQRHGLAPTSLGPRSGAHNVCRQSRARWGSAYFCLFGLENVARAVNHSQDINLIGFHVVYESIRSLYDLSNLIELVLGNCASRKWEGCNLLRAFRQPIGSFRPLYLRALLSNDMPQGHRR